MSNFRAYPFLIKSIHLLLMIKLRFHFIIIEVEVGYSVITLLYLPLPLINVQFPLLLDTKMTKTQTKLTSDKRDFSLELRFLIMLSLSSLKKLLSSISISSFSLI